MVSSGTRRQCAPVYGDFSSIASAIRRTNDSNSSCRSSSRRLLVSAIAAWEPSDSARRCVLSENGTISPSSIGLISCNTPTTTFSWLRIGTVRTALVS